jgi:hypothetical protein
MNSTTFYEDNETIVTSEAIVHHGERIPTKLIKRVSIEGAKDSIWERIGYGTPGWAEIVIEMSGFRKTRKTIRGFYGFSVRYCAMFCPIYKNTPGFKLIASKTEGMEGNDQQVLAILRKDPEVNIKDLELIEYSLSDYKRLIKIKDAIVKAMAG